MTAGAGRLGAEVVTAWVTIAPASVPDVGQFPLLCRVPLTLGSGPVSGRPRALTETSSNTRLRDRHNSATLLQFPNHSPLWESSHRTLNFHRKLRSGRRCPGLDKAPAGVHHASQWLWAALPCSAGFMIERVLGFQIWSWGLSEDSVVCPGKEAGQRQDCEG